MRIKTIWTIPAMDFSERLSRTRDWIAFEIGSWLPLRVRYWVTLQEISKASEDSPDIPATSLGTLLGNLDRPKNLS